MPTKKPVAKKLSNGVTVVAVPMRETKAVTVLVYLPVGSRYENDGLAGASHFIEHLMFKGTKRRPDTTKISKELDAIGAEYNAFTGKEYTGYYIKAAAEHLPLACDMLADMVSESLFEEKEMQRERGVIIEEINMYEDNPMMHIDDLLEEALYPGTPLGRNIAGTRETMTAMKREAVIKHRDQFYRPGMMTVILAGNLPKTLPKLLAKTFGAINSNKQAAPKQPAKVAWKGVHFAKLPVSLKKKDTEQVQLALGFPCPGYGNEKMPALSMLSIILGGNMSSRLFIQVRERRGLCYSVRAGVNPYRDLGTFMIQSGLVKERVEEAIGVISDELRDIKKNGVTKEELANAKEFLKGKIVLDLEESSEVADWYGRQQLMSGAMFTPEEKIKRFLAVTEKDVQKIANEVFRADAAALALIGPFENGEAFRKALVL